MPDNRLATIARIKARLQVYSAVARQVDLKPTASVYYRQRDIIISKSIVRWAERPNNAAVDPDEAIASEAKALVEKDKTIAQKYQNGVEIAGKTVYLKDIIDEDKKRLKRLKAIPIR